MKKPVIDMAECILCEICTALAPHAFRLSDLGYIEVLPLEDYGDDDIHEAMKNCPKDCISWDDD